METELREFLMRGVLALEAQTAALESLAEDPVVNLETKPPVCPNCQTMNPKVRVEESQAEGPLIEFVIQAHCQHCNRVFYGIPVQWEAFTDTAQVKNFMQERVEAGGYNR